MSTSQMPTRYPTTATFLAHTAHAERGRQDDSCRVCQTQGATRITWDAFTALWPAIQPWDRDTEGDYRQANL